MVKEFEQNVRIVASTVTINVAVSGTVQVNIASISSGVTFNVAIQSSAVTLNVAIQSSAVTLNVSVQNAYLYIRTETGQNLNIDIKAQSVGNLNVAIASSAITLNVAIQSSAVTLNVAITSSVTLNVNIASQGAFNLNVAIASSAVTLQVNIASQTSNLNVNLAASAITLNVAIASSAVTLNVAVQGTANVNIAASSATISIQTTGGIEIGVGKKETTPIGRTISNDAGTGQWLQSIATDKYGKLFPNSMRGQLHNIPIYVKNATGSAVNLVLKYAVRPLMADQFSTITSITAGFEGWKDVAVAKYWDYDSLFVYAENAALSIGMDTPASDNDADCFAYISGAWQWLGYRPWIRANLKVQAHYPLTVDGIVSIKNIDDRVVKPPWYQPNFTTSNQSYAGWDVAPHNETVRWTYTVPAGKIAQVMCANVMIMRISAPTSAGDAYAFITVQDTARFCYVWEKTSATGIARYESIGVGAILRAGQTLKGYTRDASTGGTYLYGVFANIMEFDA